MLADILKSLRRSGGIWRNMTIASTLVGLRQLIRHNSSTTLERSSDDIDQVDEAVIRS
jgi:hypothetical protein